jgi:2'-5' RNA ligase
MLRIVATSSISNPVEATRALSKYNGMDVDLQFNGKSHPITFLRANATGDKVDDQLTLDYLWRYTDTKDFEQVYNGLRSAINKPVRIQIGREEFNGVLNDTTVTEAGSTPEDALKHKFTVVISGIQADLPREAKAHSGSIVELLVPDNIWAHICQFVPGAKKLQDPPHITLCYVDVTKSKVEEIQTALTELCSTWAPFQVNVTGCGMFPSTKAKVPHYARIESPDLVKFREQVVSRIQSIDPDYVDLEEFPTFVPHLTVQYAAKDEKLPEIKPVSWVARSCSFSFKGTDKTVYPFSFVTDRFCMDPTVKPGTEVEASVITGNNIRELAGSISSKLIALGYNREAACIENTASTVLAKKKKRKKDTSVDSFVAKLRSQLSSYMPTYHIDHATNSIMNLLTDDHVDMDTTDNTDFYGDSSDFGEGGDFGGGGGGDGGGVEGAALDLNPLVFNDGQDSHAGIRNRAPQTQSIPTGMGGNKALPFMERMSELRKFIKDCE